MIVTRIGLFSGYRLSIVKGIFCASILACLSGLPALAVDYYDPIENIIDPLLSSGNGWAVQAGADGLGASVSVLDRSPLNGSLLSIRQMGGLVTSTTQRIWKNFKAGSSQVNINSGAYIWEWDFKVIRNGSTNTYILRNRLEGLNNNFNEQVATVGLVINPNDGLGTQYSGIHPMLANYPGGGSMDYQFFATELQPNRWYRCISYLDFDEGTHTGPTIMDITGGSTTNYVINGSAQGAFNPNPAGGFFSNVQCSTFGAGNNCPVTEGWCVDNQRLSQALRVTGTAKIEGVFRPLDFNEEGVSLLFVGNNGVQIASPLTPTFANGEGAYKVMVKPGTYNVYAFVTGCLSKLVAANLTINADTTLPSITLLSGDVDGDDVVSVFDYIRLSDAFDSSAYGGPGGGPTANWDPASDLDRDGVVSIFDYLLVSDNFDRLGDFHQ